jgi:malonyl-CoA/methylmalonyl-CoA synthetase
MTPLEGVVRLADQNAYSAFAARFLPHAGRRFVESFDGRTFSYDDLHRITAQMAGLLARHGVRKGDRVAGLLDKSPEAIMLYFAAVRAGALYMPVSSALTPPEVEYLMRDAGPRVAICAPEREASLQSIAKACGIERIFTLDGSGRGSFGAEFAGRDPDFESVACSGRDGNAIVYTSGTTGKPKGAVISNGLAVTNAIALGEAWQFDRDDVLLHANPPAFSIFGTTTPVVACGASMILLPKFDAGSVVSLLPRATVFAGVPTYYSRLLERADFTRAACAGMRLFITGSAPMRPDLFTAFTERTGTRPARSLRIDRNAARDVEPGGWRTRIRRFGRASTGCRAANRG